LPAFPMRQPGWGYTIPKTHWQPSVGTSTPDPVTLTCWETWECNLFKLKLLLVLLILLDMHLSRDVEQEPCAYQGNNEMDTNNMSSAAAVKSLSVPTPCILTCCRYQLSRTTFEHRTMDLGQERMNIRSWCLNSIPFQPQAANLDP
jgi:hypothetical protein